MSLQLETHAEIVKIAHLMQQDPAEFEYLAGCDPDTLVELRLKLVELFYGDENSSLKRFAKVGNLLPAGVIASLTRETVGPVLAARIAGFVDPKQAANVVSKLPTDFVVEIATMIDPRRVAPVLGRLNDDTVEALALELIDREEFVTLGQFVGFANEETLRRVFKAAPDDALLQIAFVAEDKDRISVALAPQTDERIASIIKTALKNDLWPEAMDLFTQLSDEQYVRVINIAGNLPPASIDRIISATVEAATWPILIPAVAQMDNPNRSAQALLRADDNALLTFSRTLIDDAAWDEAVDLFDKLNEENRTGMIVGLNRLDLVDEFVASAPPEILQAAFAFASDEIILRAGIAAADRENFSAVLEPQDDARLLSLIKSALKLVLWGDSLSLFADLSEDQYTRIVEIASGLTPAVMDRMVAETTADKKWPVLIGIVASMEQPDKACEALLRGDNADVKAFAAAVIDNGDWDTAGEILAKLSLKNRDELIKRLSRLKLAEGFVNALSVIPA
jgi:hypothetical protein